MWTPKRATVSMSTPHCTKLNYIIFVFYKMDFLHYDDFKIACGAGNIQNLRYLALLLAVLITVTMIN